MTAEQIQEVLRDCLGDEILQEGPNLVNSNDESEQVEDMSEQLQDQKKYAVVSVQLLRQKE